MAKKNKEELKPEIYETKSEIDTKEMKSIVKSIEDNTFTQETNNKEEGFVKGIVKDMFSPKNISMKTEYLSVHENFVGTKLEFLGKYAGQPLSKEFIEVFEQKRVSYLRKGRKEGVMLTQEARREEQQQDINQFRRMLGVE